MITPDGVTFADLAQATRRTWRSALIWGLVGMVVTTAVWFVRPKVYAARTAFVPEQAKVRSVPSGIGALAAQFGLDLAMEGGRSPQFYRDLVNTGGLLTSVLDSAVAIAPGESVTVRAMLGTAGADARAAQDRYLRRLRKRVSADVNARTSVVTLTVMARSPIAAEGLAALLIGAIKQFNLASRQLKARELRAFLERRSTEAAGDLRRIEDELRQFYERNRRLTDSPQLQFDESRLKRQVDLRQELFTTLSQQLESARIEEVNDTPTVTIIDPPFASSKPQGPGLRIALGLGLLLGIAARLLPALLRSR